MKKILLIAIGLMQLTFLQCAEPGITIEQALAAAKECNRNSVNLIEKYLKQRTNNFKYYTPITNWNAGIGIQQTLPLAKDLHTLEQKAARAHLQKLLQDFADQNLKLSTFDIGSKMIFKNASLNFK